MFDVYILKSLKDFRTYIGFSRNAFTRLEDHNLGKVKATKLRRPLEIIFIERVATLRYAKQRELYWKSGAGRRKLKTIYNAGSRPLMS